jgi:hypothetical protein
MVEQSVASRHGAPLDSRRSRWTGQQLDEATDGVVARPYFVNLKKGRINGPGYQKMAAIA